MPTVNYLWDFESDNVLMEKDGNGDTIAEYTHEPGEFGALISQRRNGQTYFHHYDSQGSTRTVTDQNQNVVETATYSAFGETVAKTSSITNPFGFKGALGYYANPETNDIYVRARTLNVHVGRWLSLDPAEFIDGPNRYIYAFNCPLAYFDASGLWCQTQEKCCCCASDVNFRDVGLKDIPGGGGQYYGVDVDLITVWKPSEKFLDCTLEWWEWLSIPPAGTYKKKRLPAREWIDMHVKQKESPTLKPWYERTEVTDCKEAKPITTTIHDTVVVTAPTGRVVYNLYYAVVLRSADGCDCDPAAVDDYAHLNITVRNNKLVIPPTGLKIGDLPKPPGYPNGLPLNKPGKKNLEKMIELSCDLAHR